MKWENLPRGQSLAFPEKKSVLATAPSSGSMSENLVTAALSFCSPSEKEPGDCSLFLALCLRRSLGTAAPFLGSMSENQVTAAPSMSESRSQQEMIPAFTFISSCGILCRHVRQALHK